MRRPRMPTFNIEETTGRKRAPPPCPGWAKKAGLSVVLHPVAATAYCHHAVATCY